MPFYFCSLFLLKKIKLLMLVSQISSSLWKSSLLFVFVRWWWSVQCDLPFHKYPILFAGSMAFELYTHRYYNGKTRTVCYMLWPDGKYPTSTADYVWVNLFFPAPLWIVNTCFFVFLSFSLCLWFGLVF